jgi:shikimate kinase
MLARQAIEAQKIWNPGVAFDTDAIEAAIFPELSRELLRHSPMRLLLTGFMGAGKSTVGKMLAAELGTAFTDIDAEIEKETGRSIADIFARDGEAAFRGIEREVAARALKQNTSSVVASGGGLPVSMENQALIRETNTLVLHLDAPFETLWARVAGCVNRPLLEDRPRAECLYQTRQPVYHAFCDFAFNAAQPLSQLTSDITVQLTHTGNQHDSRP